MYTVCLVIFIVVMLLWAFTNSGTIDKPAANHWVALVAVLVLGIVVFLLGGGLLTVTPIR